MKRLYGLDALRGLAALVVVIWHWQHFYDLTGVWQKGWHYQAEPFFDALWPLYLQGWAAVDIFFALSGYVFYWLYSDRIAAREIPVGLFAVRRISRLYPLHVLALVLVLVLQYFFHARSGGYFVYASGDWHRFGAALLMAQQWLPPTIEQTFNGPAWTVSVEAGLYILFFLLCRLGLKGPKAALTVSLLGITIFSWNECIARGMIGFFLGGACYFAVRAIEARADAVRWARWCVGIALAFWVITVWEIGRHTLHGWAENLTDYLGADDFYAEYNVRLFQCFYDYTVVPASIVAVALHESVLNSKWMGEIYRRLSRLGDISYATYMLHFPLQLTLALVALHMGFGSGVFEHGLTLIAFYAVLIGLGYWTWQHIELPVQQFLRRFSRP